MENTQGTGSLAAARNIECFIDQVKIKSNISAKGLPVWVFLNTKVPKSLQTLSTKFLRHSHRKKSLNPENYEVSIFQSSSPAQKGPLMIKVGELALNDHVSTKFSSIMPSAEIAKKIDSLQLSVFKSSTPTQQADFVRRFEKLGLHDFFSYHFSPISSEPEMKIEPFTATRSQALNRCNRKLAF